MPIFSTGIALKPSDFLAVFRHHADEVRADGERDVEDLAGVAHFEIELGGDVLTQEAYIGVLNVAAVSPQVNGDGMSASGLGLQGGSEDGRLGVRRVQHRTIARLAQRDDVVDVDTEKQVGLGHAPYVARSTHAASLVSHQTYLRRC